MLITSSKNIEVKTLTEKRHIMPRRIIEACGVENTDQLYKNRELQLISSSAVNLNDDFLVIKKGGYILLDFGVELCGGIEMAVQTIGTDIAAPKCRVVFGESVTEARSTIGEKNSGNNHTIRDMIIDVVSLGTFRYGDTGFRFVKLEAVNADLYIKTVKAVCDVENFEYIGDFECNDPVINEIWKTGAYTVELCTHDYIWDGVKRDRLVWIGDMHPEVSTISAVFGNLPAIKNSLDLAKNTAPDDQWMNSTASYSMWWIIINYDYFMHWGDFDYLAEQKAYLMHLCENIIKWADSGFEGPSNEMKGFVDWSSKYTESEMEGRWAVGCMSLECAIKIFGYLQNDEYAEKCSKCLNNLLKQKPLYETNKSISALTVLSGRDAHYAKKVLAGSLPEGMSCFMGYYVLKAKAKLGEWEESLELIKNYWGEMLKVGATTFWEEFDVAWLENSGTIDALTPKDKKDIHGDFGKHCYEQLRLSLCHGWASGPTPYLMEQIGGIEILEPGCKSIKISPKLASLEWIRVVYPTPYGKVKIFATKTKNGVETTVDAPEVINIIKN